MVGWNPGPLPAPLGFTGGYDWSQWAPYIAQYESGGNPTATNPQSSASGLYGIINSTWNEYGGSQFAPTAAQATPDQQYQVAQNIFNANGAQPWATAQSAYNSMISGIDPYPANATTSNPFFIPGTSDALVGGNSGVADNPGGGFGNPGNTSPGMMGTPNPGASTVNSLLGGEQGGVSGFFTAVGNWLQGAFFRGIIVIIGLLLIAGAIFMMSFGQRKAA